MIVCPRRRPAATLVVVALAADPAAAALAAAALGALARGRHAWPAGQYAHYNNFSWHQHYGGGRCCVPRLDGATALGRRRRDRDELWARATRGMTPKRLLLPYMLPCTQCILLCTIMMAPL